MDGEQDGAQAQGEEQQGQQGDPQADDKQQGQKAPVQVGAPDDEEIRAALAERDEKIAELESQMADAAKRCEFELHPGCARCRKAAGRANLAGWLGASLVRASFLFGGVGRRKSRYV